MPTSQKASRPRGVMREKMIEIGEALLNEKGAAEFSLREIARRLGVSHNAPHKHFPGKEALLAEIATRGFQRLNETIERSAASGDIPQGVTRGVAYVRFAVENPVLFRLMFANPAHPGMDAQIASASAAGLGGLADFMKAFYTEDRYIDAAIAAWSIVHGLAVLLLEDRIPNEMIAGRSAERLADDVLTTLHMGLTLGR